jgi:hypothetical protein
MTTIFKTFHHTCCTFPNKSQKNSVMTRHGKMSRHFGTRGKLTDVKDSSSVSHVTSTSYIHREFDNPLFFSDNTTPYPVFDFPALIPDQCDVITPPIERTTYRVMGYLVGTPHFKIYYNTPVYPELRNTVYDECDASFLDDRLTRKSQQGHLIFYNSGPIIWKCNRQRKIVLSTMKGDWNPP